MATVEQAINPHTELQQTSTVNSTLNFIPSATTNNWGAAPSYGGIWEAASSTITTDHGNDERQAGNPMSRMAFYDHTVGAFIIDTNVNWLGQNINALDGGATASAAPELQYFNQLSPSSEAVSSCVLTEENTSDYLTKASELIKRQRELEHDEGSLPKKQRSAAGAVSNKELITKQDTVASNDSSEAGGLALNTNGRPRAKRGSATDPQSVYARQRRERINERLKILQNLVPNGAKVDIVTMLEEAISYVKFLQLQVKLLSSDEYWMYAPTTYNGIDVSFDMLQPSN